jgi:CheY-like chemotaxis protein
MAKIALVDDSKDQRETYKKLLSLFLKAKESSLEVIDIFPFKEFTDYYSWIIDENIVVLIFDEKLYNDSDVGLEPVNYNGSFLVKKIRERFKDIPIFTLTNFPDDEELQRNFNQFEYILSKNDFAQKHVDIILRASQRYLDENQKQLALFDNLTKKIASGNAEGNDIEVLKALQVKLQIPVGIDLKDREDWLKDYENQIAALELIKKNLESKIKK